MTQEQINKFLECAESYRFHKKLLEHLNDRIDVLLYKLAGVSSISSDGFRVKGSELEKALRKHDQYDRYNELLKTYEAINEKKKYTEAVINSMKLDDAELFKLKYYDGYSYERIAKMCYLSKTGIIYRFNKTLKELEL